MAGPIFVDAVPLQHAGPALQTPPVVTGGHVPAGLPHPAGCGCAYCSLRRRGCGCPECRTTESRVQVGLTSVDPVEGVSLASCLDLVDRIEARARRMGERPRDALRRTAGRLLALGTGAVAVDEPGWAWPEALGALARALDQDLEDERLGLASVDAGERSV